MRHFLLVLRPNAGGAARLTGLLARLNARIAITLPHALIVVAPEQAREQLAALPGVAHAGGVEIAGRPIKRLRQLPDGRILPAEHHPA